MPPQFKWILPLFFIFLYGSCKKVVILKEVKDEHNQVIEKYFVDTTNGKKEGRYEAFHENGKMSEETFYKHDSIEGVRKLYSLDGRLVVEENYLSGIYHGKFTSYYPNGKVNVIGFYLNGVMDGQWKRYYDTGELMEETTFKENEENGPFTEYYTNGKKRAEGNYVNGQYEHGELKLYDENGELIKKMNCENGICTTTWQKQI